MRRKGEKSQEMNGRPFLPVEGEQALGVADARAPVAEPAIDLNALARIALIEYHLEQLGDQVALCLRSHQKLANSIRFMFEQQMRDAGSMGSGASPAS